MAVSTCRCLRWAFNIAAWEPSQTEWMLAVQSIQLEELEKANSFYFRNDIKAAVVGRLLIRQSIRTALNIPWREIRLERSDKGKPIIGEPTGVTDFSFNVSHQGGFVVLASSCGSQVGIDTMKLDMTRLGGRSVPEYLELMKSNFSDLEYVKLQIHRKDKDKMARFYRFWCLKESYLKAIGVGITQNLRNVSFSVGKFSDLTEENQITTTMLDIEGNANDNWQFEESFIAPDHFVTVCIQRDRPSFCRTEAIPFKKLSFSELIQDAQPLHQSSYSEWQHFQSKTHKLSW